MLFSQVFHLKFYFFFMILVQDFNVKNKKIIAMGWAIIFHFLDFFKTSVDIYQNVAKQQIKFYNFMDKSDWWKITYTTSYIQF